MTIKRTINGVEHSIDLTPEELRNAHAEAEHGYYMDDIAEQWLNEQNGDLPDKAVISELAEKFAEELQDCDGWHEWYWHICEFVIDTYKEEKNNENG